MPLPAIVVLALSPSPSPSPSVKEPDPDTVSPGWWGFLSLVFLCVTVYLIWRGLNKQLKRVDFDENDPQAIARGPRELALTEPADAPAVEPGGGDPDAGDPGAGDGARDEGAAPGVPQG